MNKASTYNGSVPARHLTLKITVGVLYIIYFAVSFIISYRQQYNPQGPMGNYTSDLPAHISAGAEGNGYSLLEIIYGFFARGIPGSRIFIALILAIITTLSVYLVYRLFLLIISSVGLTLTRKYLLHIAAFIPTIVMPLFIQKLNPYCYLGLQCGVNWHNDTYTGMRTAALLVVIIFYSLMLRYRKKLLTKELILLFIVAFAANWIKPNFIMAFGPAAFILLFCDFIKDRGKTVSSQIKLMLPLVLSLVIIVFQTMSVFGEESSEGGIGFSVAYMLKLNTVHPVASLLQSAAFPLLILVINFGRIGKDRIFTLTWITWLLGLLEYLFIHEEGIRKDNGNFTWGYSFCIFLVMCVSLAYLIQGIRSLAEKYEKYRTGNLMGEGSGNILRFIASDKRTLVLCVLYFISVILLLMHTYYGLKFGAKMLLGAPYYI